MHDAKRRIEMRSACEQPLREPQSATLPGVAPPAFSVPTLADFFFLLAFALSPMPKTMQFRN
ncbi:hypothetical protein [Burkholderia gladioli]|uniref:hypothetical protein n=1 Tax=Burkholderia gladioli TaxID=28095 RepID=UPI0034DABF61